LAEVEHAASESTSATLPMTLRMQFMGLSWFGGTLAPSAEEILVLIIQVRRREPGRLALRRSLNPSDEEEGIIVGTRYRYAHWVKTSDLTRLYPRIYHMAADGSWPSIAQHGLLSTAALVDRWAIESASARSALLTQRREESQVLEHTAYGTATVRDQKPIHEPSLAEALDDMTVGEWYEVLNERVFFFLQPERLDGLLNARSYKNSTHTVLTIDTASLVAAHESEIELCAFNSGFAQRHSKARRGRDTFKAIADYPHPNRHVARTGAHLDVAELSVLGGVVDIRDHIIRVDRMRQSEVIERLV
jgi:hypothetical protein